MRSSWLVGVSLGALAMFGVAGCSSTTGSGSSATTSGGGGSTGSPQNGGSYQLPAAVTSLRIDGDAVAVDVTAQEKAAGINVTEQRHGRATTAKDVTGSSATLTAKCPSGFHFGESCSVEYTVTMPAQATLKVDNTTGDVKLMGPFADATVSTTAGRLTGTALGAGTYEVTTDVGESDLTFATPPNSVKVKSDVGEVKLTVPGGTKYAVTTHTTVGSADVAVDQDSSSTHRLDVSTTVGAIQISKG
jgi:Toastrack DUF4097